MRRIDRTVEMHAGRASGGQLRQLLNETDLLLLVGDRAARLRCRGRDHDLPPSVLTVASPGDVVCVDLPDAALWRVFHLPPGLLAALGVLPGSAAEAVARDGARIAWTAAGPGVCHLADDVESEGGVGRLLEVAGIAGRCAVHALVEEPTAHPVIHRVREHLRRCFARRIGLDDLAGMAGMSRFALVRAFAREVGMPPHTYQTQLRVQRARELIALGWPLSEVSLEVGFTDQSHLNRHFKRLVGITPGAYARSVAAPRATRTAAFPGIARRAPRDAKPRPLHAI